MDELLELVIDVLKIADEYLMDRLKEICENVLGDQGNIIVLVCFVRKSTLAPIRHATLPETNITRPLINPPITTDLILCNSSGQDSRHLPGDLAHAHC
jgi:hypothetical protein